MLLRNLNENPIWKRRIRVFEHSFRAPTLDRLVSLWLHRLGILGAGEVRVIRRLVTKNMTVVDVGANQGLYTLLLAGLSKPGTVYAFEPLPSLYQQLISNVRENGADNVVCHQMAVSNFSGILNLQKGRLNSGDNRIVTGDSKSARIVEVRASTLDELLGGKTVGFLKMDVQGWEAKSLAGAESILERNRDIVIMFEFWPYGLIRAGDEPTKLLHFLQGLGFNLWRLQNGKLRCLQDAALPDKNKELSYCNLIGTRNPTLVKDLLI
jgi:FkbM family methyltransferase